MPDQFVVDTTQPVVTVNGIQHPHQAVGFPACTHNQPVKWTRTDGAELLLAEDLSGGGVEEGQRGASDWIATARQLTRLLWEEERQRQTEGGREGMENRDHAITCSAVQAYCLHSS